MNFITAGTDIYNKTGFLNLTSQEWTDGPTMTTPRWGHTCSLVTLDSGQKEIVIVGGRTSAGNDPDNCTIGSTITLRDVEILNLETNTIRPGK